MESIGLQENVIGNPFSTCDSLQDHPQGIQSCATQRERGSVPQAAGSETLFARDDNSIQKSSLYLSDFPSEAMLWIKGVEMVDSLEEFAMNFWNDFPIFEMLDAKMSSALNKG